MGTKQETNADTGILDQKGNRIANLGAPANPNDAATRDYVDTHGGGGGDPPRWPILLNDRFKWSPNHTGGYDKPDPVAGGIVGSSNAIVAVDQVSKTFSVAGDQTAYLEPGMVFWVAGSTLNDGEYTIVSATYDETTNTDIVVVEAIPDDANVDGNLNCGGALFVAGDKTSKYPVGKSLYVVGSTINDTTSVGCYIVAAVSYDAGSDQTRLTARRQFTSDWVVSGAEANGVIYSDLGGWYVDDTLSVVSNPGATVPLEAVDGAGIRMNVAPGDAIVLKHALPFLSNQFGVTKANHALDEFTAEGVFQMGTDPQTLDWWVGWVDTLGNSSYLQVDIAWHMAGDGTFTIPGGTTFTAPISPGSKYTIRTQFRYSSQRTTVWIDSVQVLDCGWQGTSPISSRPISEFVAVFFRDAAAINPITGVNQTTPSFDVAGDWTAYFTAGRKFWVDGSTGNDGLYTTVSSSFASGTTTIVVVEAIPDATADGSIYRPDHADWMRPTLVIGAYDPGVPLVRTEPIPTGPGV